VSNQTHGLVKKNILWRLYFGERFFVTANTVPKSPPLNWQTGDSANRRGIQYVEHTEGDGGEMFGAVCKLGLEGIVSKRLDAPYRSGPSRTWIKVKNPKAPAGTRAIDGTF